MVEKIGKLYENPANAMGSEYNLKDGLDWERIHREYLQRVNPSDLEVSLERAAAIQKRPTKAINTALDHRY